MDFWRRHQRKVFRLCSEEDAQGLSRCSATRRLVTCWSRVLSSPAFVPSITYNCSPTCLVFLDESGVTTEMTRRYGRAPRGERVAEGVPAGHWRTLTLLAALTTEGVRASMMIESPTDGDVFLAYVEQVLCPRLEPGHLVILDNLAAHKLAAVRQLIQSRGAQVLYLPPYSPDFNPIEQAWSKLKQELRGAKARLLGNLESAVAQAIAAITPENARAWFRHCGYGIQQL